MQKFEPAFAMKTSRIKKEAQKNEKSLKKRQKRDTTKDGDDNPRFLIL